MMLPPLPVTRDDASHVYRRTDIHHVFPVSITQVIGAVTLTPADRENIERHRDSWEPRGNTVHACLEQWLKTTVRPSDDEMGTYRDWVLPLIDHPIWSKCEVIGAELCVYDMRRNWAGCLDVVVKWHSGGHGVIDLKTKSRPGSSKQDVRPQLGAGTLAVIDHYLLSPERNAVLWAYPGETRIEGQEVQPCIDAWLDVLDCYCLTHRQF